MLRCARRTAVDVVLLLALSASTALAGDPPPGARSPEEPGAGGASRPSADSLASPARADLGVPAPGAGLEDRVRRLVVDLGSDAWQAREKATQELLLLLRRGEPVAALVARALDSADPEVAQRARLILDQTGGRGRAPDPSVEKAERLLERVGRRPVVSWSYRDQSEPKFFEWDLDEAASGISSDAAMDILISALSSENGTLRRNVAYLLGRLGSTRAVPFLEQALSDADPEVRVFALFSLASLGDADAVPAILETPPGQPTPVRVARMIVLERFPDDASVRACLDGLRDESAEVRYHAYYTLRRWTGQELGFNAWYPEAGRAAAVSAWEAWWLAHREGFEFPAPRDH
ncbi:MAG: HEAT repeat domain-containing protein [Planctomycetes bacterium]|nr:HEAT repeat domain-containing protein [Planctomycetota bacterium]